MAARVVVIGAGPAGVRAAQACVDAGLAPVVIDENRRAGGQIYRRAPDGFTRGDDALYGTEAAKASAVHSAFAALAGRIDYRPDTLVWNIEPGAVHAICGTRTQRIAFDALIVCSGAADRLMPVPGWQRAGVYSLGGAQIALKAQGCAIGSRIVMMGTGPLLYLAAAQYVKAGACVAAVLDTSTPAQRLAALPRLLALPAALRKGVALVSALRRAGVPVHRGARPVAIDGDDDAGVTGVRIAMRDGRTLEIECDAVALGYHVRSETQLADLAGCAFRFDADARQWLPDVDADGRSSVKGVYLAGDGVRVRGADAAERSGRLAALAALADLKIADRAHERRALRAELARYERFASGLRRAFPWPAHLAAALPDDTIVCRCEGIRAGELRRVVTEMGACEANRAKAFSRVGMGRCQGRYCSHAGAEVIAAAAGVPLESVGRLRGQAPVKPLPVAIETIETIETIDAEAIDTETTGAIAPEEAAE